MLSYALMFLLLLQQPPAQKQEQKQQPAKKPDVTAPPTDVTAPPIDLNETKPVVYSLDPAKAKKEVEVGNFYFKKRNFAAAVARFEEATKWNPKFELAYLRLGQAREKKGELTKSLEAYRKYLELDPQSKQRKDVEKAIARIEKELKEH